MYIYIYIYVYIYISPLGRTRMHHKSSGLKTWVKGGES